MLVTAAYLTVPATTVIHELGHLLVGMAFGVPVSEVRLGGEKRRWTIRFGSNFRLLLGWPPFSGHVEFQWLPLSRGRRIAMYAGGVGATLLAAIVVCAVPLAGKTAYQAGILLLVALSGLENLAMRHPEKQSGRWTDGEAIRGLRAYGKNAE
ncbi:site-2 protease family protein [Burkholderia stabilis]|uniref:site-2 protease family protein n=1 Tax=Burkholderia stabilis TaxID=95485 RepID=UPI003D36DD12